MCGLVGVLGSKSFYDHKWLTYARKTLIHRGPDDHGEWWSENNQVGLAHQRLAIIDLGQSGHQPMHLLDHGLTIIFNGEIYNHNELRQKLTSIGYSFKSNSDTEVLLASYAEWGNDCLKFLNGMFAFAIYDSFKDELFMARDRAGEKPLFYFLDKGTLYFASELKALLNKPDLPRKIDPDSFDCYLSFGFVPGKRCIFYGYNKLESAHALTFNLKNKSLHVWRYWDKHEIKSKIINNTNLSLVEELEKLLEDAITKQMVADVPIGILLSGGLDSSLLTAIASRNKNQVQTFSVGFPGYDNYDETTYSEMIASYFKTKHTKLKIDSNIKFEDILNKLINHYDEPIVDSSMIPSYLLCQEVRKYCTVVLGGDGGDELFGGYNHYQRLLQMKKYLKFIPKFALTLTSLFAKKFLPIGFTGRNYLQNSNIDFKKDLPLIATYFNKDEREKLLKEKNNLINNAESIRSDSIPNVEDLIDRATHMDFENYLKEDILVKIDRASMANSLEIRAPFLDYRILNFAFNKVPSNLKVNFFDKKILLKKLASKILPPQFNLKRKHGFCIPLNDWLIKGEIRDYFWDILTSKDCIFNKEIIINLFNGVKKGRNNSERIFSLVQFELWRKKFNAHF